MLRLPQSLRALSPATRWTLAIAVLLGLAIRIGWAIVRPTKSATGEAYNIAAALAQGRGYADAFAVGQGPTAHLLPLPPLFAGGVYTLFGLASPTAEAVLMAWALALTFATFALFAAIAHRLGLPRRACVAGFVFLSVMPLFTSVETFDFRAWEGGMTMATAGAYLLLLVRADGGEPLGRRARVALAALPALLLFLQPVVGLAGCAAGAVALIRGRIGRPSPTMIGAFLMTLAVLFGGWTARNAITLGQPIWLRDNLGLELAVANYPAAVTTTDPDATFQARLAEVHPMFGAAAYRRLQSAGGGAAYAHQLGEQTLAWMKANPASVAQLWLGHLHQIVLPAPWEFRTTHGRVMPVFRAVVFDLVSVLGFAGLALLLWRRRSQALLIAPFVTVPVLAYVPFQPIIRYIWLIYPPLVYLAAYTFAEIAAAAKPRRQS